jgi:tetratricopeptide (TPR) repeat protein
MDDTRYLGTLLAFVLFSTGALTASFAIAGPKIKPTAPPAGAAPRPSQLQPSRVRPGGDPDPAPGTMPEEARLERITVNRPGDTAAHLAAARHYLEQSYGAESRLVDASRHADAVLKSEPRNFDALMVSGDIESQRHRPDFAAQHYRNATEANPNSKEAALALSGALDRAGDHLGAQEAFAKYRRLSGMGSVPSSVPAKSADGKPN